jgi:hypothetical protein
VGHAGGDPDRHLELPGPVAEGGSAATQRNPVVDSPAAPEVTAESAAEENPQDNFAPLSAIKRALDRPAAPLASPLADKWDAITKKNSIMRGDKKEGSSRNKGPASAKKGRGGASKKENGRRSKRSKLSAPKIGPDENEEDEAPLEDIEEEEEEDVDLGSWADEEEIEGMSGQQPRRRSSAAAPSGSAPYSPSPQQVSSITPTRLSPYSPELTSPEYSTYQDGLCLAEPFRLRPYSSLNGVERRLLHRLYSDEKMAWINLHGDLEGFVSRVFFEITDSSGFSP